MLFEITILDDLIEVLASGAIQVREATVVLRDGQPDARFGRTYHRYVLAPGSDLEGKPPRIVAVAKAVWTPDVVTAWLTSQRAGVTPSGRPGAHTSSPR